MSFADVQHQDEAVRAIEQTLAADRVPHGFIFCGPSGVGKAMAARAMARALLCETPRKGRTDRAAPQACGKCPQCRMVDRDTHPDLSWYRKPADRAEFPIHIVTRRPQSPDGPTINESVHWKPMQAARRVTVIEDAEQMNAEAANAFLKTFEEAPAGSFLVLIVAAIDRLLPTIRSRGRLVRFAALPPEFVAELLERDHELSADDARVIARFSEGGMDQAAALARSGFLELRREITTVLPGLSRADALTLADAIDAWASERARAEKQTKARVEENTLRRAYLKRALGLLASVFRDAMLAAASEGNDSERWLNADLEPFIRETAARVPADRLEEAVRRLHEYQTYVDRNAHNQLLLETACLQTADWLAPSA